VASEVGTITRVAGYRLAACPCAIPSARAMTSIAKARIDSVERRGKWLRVALDDWARALLASRDERRMGALRAGVQPAGAISERVRIDVALGAKTSSVRYLDMRMFGRGESSRRRTPRR